MCLFVDNLKVSSRDLEHQLVYVMTMAWGIYMSVVMFMQHQNKILYEFQFDFPLLTTVGEFNILLYCFDILLMDSKESVYQPIARVRFSRLGIFGSFFCFSYCICLTKVDVPMSFLNLYLFVKAVLLTMNSKG